MFFIVSAHHFVGIVGEYFVYNTPPRFSLELWRKSFCLCSTDCSNQIAVGSIMKYLLNTHFDDNTTRVCIFDLYAELSGLGLHATLNDWSGYKNYDIVVFVSYDHDIERARRENPNIKVVIADPKLTSRKNIWAAKQADLLLVSSVEQRDAFLRLNPNILIYYMFPQTVVAPRQHLDHAGVVVAYQGNRVHAIRAGFVNNYYLIR